MVKLRLVWVRMMEVRVSSFSGQERVLVLEEDIRITEGNEGGFM